MRNKRAIVAVLSLLFFVVLPLAQYIEHHRTPAPDESAQRPSEPQSPVAERRRATMRKINPEERARLLAAFSHAPANALANANTNANANANAKPTSSETLGALDKDYIQSRILDVKPLIAECYDLILDAAKKADASAPEGKLTLEFEIVGDPELGGLVESVQSTDDSPLKNATLDECIAATISSVAFEPPKDGGRIKVRYPFSFAAK